MNNDITKQILHNKRPTIGEIELTLFEHCNIRCKFCFHNLDSTVGMSQDEMLSKLPIIEEFLKNNIDKNLEFIQINIVGGELFQNKQLKTMLPRYVVLVSEIQKLFKQYKQQLEIVWVSNFLFCDNVSVLVMIEMLRGQGVKNSLIASYDFDGRPISKQYRDNIEFFGPKYISSINCVGTTQSINTFIEEEDPYFEQLYSEFNIFFDDFIPDDGTDDLLPPDSLFLKWYTYIADHYPKIEPVAALANNTENKMHCLSLNKVTIFPDNSTSNCRWKRYKQENFTTPINYADNASMMQTHLDTYGCLSCQYFKRCGLRCFTQSDWKTRVRDLDDCPMRLFFKHIEK